jgi:hypothetical protein
VVIVSNLQCSEFIKTVVVIVSNLQCSEFLKTVCGPVLFAIPSLALVTEISHVLPLSFPATMLRWLHIASPSK